MSAGGQRSIDISGITTMRIRDAADATIQTEVRLVYQTFASTTGANAFRTRATGSDNYIKLLEGLKESCATCTGEPWQWNTTPSYR